MQCSCFACLGYWPTVAGLLTPVLRNLLHIQYCEHFEAQALSLRPIVQETYAY